MNTITARPDGGVTFAEVKRVNLPRRPLRRDASVTAALVANQQLLKDPAYYDRLPSLGLSKEINSHSTPQKPRKPRGSLGISTYQRRLTRWAVGDMERSAGIKHLSFLTWTLPTEIPSMTKQEWAEVTRQATQSLSRALQRAGLPGHIVGVVEVQMNRFRKHGGMPLHLHLVFEGRHPKSSWALSYEQLRDIWKNALMNVIKNIQVNEWGATTDIQRVKKSAAGYLGKYMSKGLKDVAELAASGQQECIPAAWNVCSLHYRREYKRQIRKAFGEYVNEIFETVKACASYLFEKWGWIEIPCSDGMPLKVAWWGYLKPGISHQDFWNQVVG